jgi:hypothetical protein
MPRLLIPLFYAFSTIPFFLITRELTRDEKTAILGSFLFAMSGDSIRLIGDLYRNVLGIPFLLWAIFFTMKSFNSKNRALYVFLSVFYVILTALTHRLCILVYFIAMLSYLFTVFFLYGDRTLFIRWALNMTPFFILAIIGYRAVYPGIVNYLSKFEPVWAVVPLEQLLNNWFFSIVTNIFALIGIYISLKKDNFRYIFAASFLMVMTVSVVVSSAIGYLMKKGGNGLEGDDFSFKKGYEHYGRYVKDLQVIGAALALAMIAQRIPVMQATSA